jgi:hypothetical protein
MHWTILAGSKTKDKSKACASILAGSECLDLDIDLNGSMQAIDWLTHRRRLRRLVDRWQVRGDSGFRGEIFGLHPCLQRNPRKLTAALLNRQGGPPQQLTELRHALLERQTQQRDLISGHVGQFSPRFGLDTHSHQGQCPSEQDQAGEPERRPDGLHGVIPFWCRVVQKV